MQNCRKIVEKGVINGWHKKKPHKRLTYEAFFLNKGGPSQT